MVEALDVVKKRISKAEEAIKNAEVLVELAKRLDIDVIKEETELNEAKARLEEFKKAVEEIELSRK